MGNDDARKAVELYLRGNGPRAATVLTDHGIAILQALSNHDAMAADAERWRYFLRINSYGESFVAQFDTGMNFDKARTAR